LWQLRYTFRGRLPAARARRVYVAATEVVALVPRPGAGGIPLATLGHSGRLGRTPLLTWNPEHTMPSDPTAHPQQPTPERSLVAIAATPPLASLSPSRVEVLAPPDDWRRILGAIRNHKWLVAVVTLAGTAAGVAAVRFLEPIYQAHAIMWVEVPDRYRPPNQGPIASGQLLGSSSGWLEVLRSNVVLDDVVRAQRLYLKPGAAADAAPLATFNVKDGVRPGKYRVEVDETGRRFALIDAENRRVLQRGSVGDSVGPALGFTWQPPSTALPRGAAVAFTVRSPGDATVKLAEELRVKQASDGNFVRVEWRASDPALVAATVNGVVERVAVVAADLRRQRLTELTRILSDQLEHARRNLRDAEAALTTFRVRHATRPAEGLAPGPDGHGIATNPTFANYLDLTVTAAQLAQDRDAIGKVAAHAADSGVSADALLMISAVQRSAELSDALKDLTAKQADLRALRFRYTDAHPPVQRLAAQVDTLQRRIIPQLARTLEASLAGREQALAQRADSVSRDLRSAPPVALEEVRLGRDQANAAQLFSNLQQRYEEARLAEVSSLPDVRVLERASKPDKPFADLAPLLVLVALVGGLGLGTLGAMTFDRMDPKVRNPDQVSRAMGLPILGAVPHLHRNGNKRERHDGTAKAVEALRGIRLNVQHAYGAAGPLLITVSSPGRGEGKSFVTSNLAQAFADVGYRTLLVDGDVRVGALHRVMRAQRRPGLTDVLAGRLPAAAVVQATAHPLLCFIGCGSRMHRGPELVSSAAVPRLMTALRSAYDVILVDSAPLAAGVDPYALGTGTGSMLLVLRTGVTDRVIAEAKLEVLHRLPIRLLGAVLNDVRPGPAYSYYAYSLAGYEAQEEDPDGVAGEILLPRRS